MPASVDQFGKAVVTSGLLSPTELKALWAEIPADKRPADGPGLAAILRERGLLNDFQAEELLSGRDTPLVLNQYVLVSKIGAGGMGQVFKAQHRKMKRLVAIKLLPSSMTKDEAAIKRFQREVEAAAKLTHPNIVAALDADECRGMHYLVMEYVEGQDLSALVKKQGPLTVPQSIDFILQAARGLAYAHAEGVVHRDIKPANLLVDKKGVVKILDMGLARIEGMGDAADHQLTNTGQVMGTVDYMAPEQATDTRMADARSDVYSLGCSLYRLLTGGNVYDGDTLIKKIMSHMHDAIPSLRAKRPDAPAELDRIFAKMMAKKPEDRYQQTSQLVTELEALRSPGGAPSQPSVVEQDSELQRFLSGVKDGKTNAPTATKAAVAPASATNVDEATAAFSSSDAITDPKSEVIAGSAVTAQKAAAGGRAPRAKPSKSKKSPPVKLIAAGALGVVLLLLGIVVVIRDDKGNKVAEVVVPPGGSVEVKQTLPTVPAKAPTPPANTSTTSPKPPTPSPVTGSTSATEFALHLKDRNDVVEAPNPGIDLLRPFTVEAYVTPGTIPASGINDAQIVGMNGCRLDVFKSGWSWYCYHSIIHAPAPIVSGRRVHLAGVRTLNQLLLYVDGKLVASKDEPIQAQPDPKPTPLKIAPSTANFLFKIDELRITQGTPYTQDFTPPARLTADKDTLLLYHFDEGQGNVVNDSSGKNLHGKLTGGQWVRRDGNSPSSALTSSSTSNEIDLLAGVDVNRDAVLGKFTLAGGLKQTDNVLQARIQLPTSSLPAEYDLHYTVARTAPGGKAFMIGFVSQGKQGSIVVDGFSNPPAWGVEMIDGKSAKENGTYQPGERVTFGSPHKIVVRVRNEGVTALCDDAVVVDWKGKASQLSTHAMWDVPRKDQLFVGFQGPYVVQAARLIPASVTAASNTNVVYLDDLTEKYYFGLKGSFAKPGRNPSDATSTSKIFAGAPLDHALHVHPEDPRFDKQKDAAALPSHQNTSRLVYDLDGKYALFQSGFRSRAGSSKLQAEVWGDGKRLWESGVPIAQHPAGTTAEVDVRGVRELTLFIWSDEGRTHVLLTEPRLTPVAPAPLGNSPGAAAAGVVYLDDLPEKDWRGFIELGKHGDKWKQDGSVINWQGAKPAHALTTYPLSNGSATVTYELGGRYSAFEAVVGITVTPRTPLTFRVFGDGKILWESPPQTKRVVSGVEVNVDLRGVETLKLEVLCPGDNNSAHAVWINPRLTPTAQPEPAGVVYLDDLTEIEWKNLAKQPLGKHGKYLYLSETTETTILFRGKPVEHTLWMHPTNPPRANLATDPTAFARYQLDGQYATFAAEAGIHESADKDPASPVTFRLLGDGRELWKSQPMQKRGESAEVTIDIRGVKELRLETASGEKTGGCHATWFMPRLTPVAIASPQPAAPSPTAVVYLDDLPELEYRVLADRALGKHGKFRDQGKDEEAIQWRGKPVTHSLWMHPPRAKDAVAFARYQLDGKYQTFAAETGIPETTSKDPQSPVQFRVFGDGRELWKSPPLQERGESAEVSVDVRGVKELRLEASSGEKNGNCHATWFMPRLTPMNDQRAGRVSLPMSPSPNTTSNPNNAGVPSNPATNTASSSSNATAPRWPLTPSQPADIQKLLDAKAEVTVRVDATKEVKLKSGDKLPAGPATIVGVSLFGNQNKADDALLEFLAKLTDLEDLNFNSNAHAATPAGVQKLAALKNLRRLSLNGLKNQADGVSDVLKSLPRLEYLYLPFGKLTSEEWAKAASMHTTITEINTYRCDLTDTGLAHLEKMSQLTIVSLVDNGDLTQAAMERFAAAVPSCRVQWGADKDRKWIEPRSITSSSLDRQVAQRLLDFKLPVKLIIAGKKSFVKPGTSLPVEPFVIEGIDSGAFAAVPRDELVKLLGEFRQLTSVENTFLPMKDCDLWAETFAAMPSIKAVVAARCDELTDVGATHLARLPKLEYLNIGSSVKLTATGLAAFEACKTLTTIELCPEAVTAGSYKLADIQKLQNALPTTRIVFGGVKPIPGLVKATD